jgi:hypothetical protein
VLKAEERRRHYKGKDGLVVYARVRDIFESQSDVSANVCADRGSGSRPVVAAVFILHVTI